MAKKRTKIALLGEKVSKSLSPFMHNEAFRHLNLPYTYEAISVPPEEFKRKFEEAGKEFLGLNITIPFKEDAFRQLRRFGDTSGSVPHWGHFRKCPQISERAGKLEAVNTVLFGDGEILGENTDVDGFLQSVLRTGFKLNEDTSIFILGAGGAARATVEALPARRLTVATRSTERLKAFKEWFVGKYSDGPQLKTLHLTESLQENLKEEIGKCAIFVNAAPLHAYESLSFFREISFPKGVLVVDWVYWPKTTPWLKKGEQAKGTLVHGYKLLLYQGMKSFEIWTGVKAPETIMEKALLKELK